MIKSCRPSRIYVKRNLSISSEFMIAPFTVFMIQGPKLNSLLFRNFFFGTMFFFIFYLSPLSSNFPRLHAGDSGVTTYFFQLSQNLIHVSSGFNRG